MPLLEYGRLTWPEVEALDRRDTIVLLPMGSVEQHGEHGPLTTDAVVSLRLCAPLAESVPEMTWLVRSRAGRWPR
jgi:creatinine amidohydrolase